MESGINLLVFTDLDGTLIDHETYRWTAARGALDALRKAGAGVVLASSKSAAEVAPLRREMNLTDWPAIVENGAGCLNPREDMEDAASRYDALRAVLADLPQDLRQRFQGFGDMTAQEVAQATGLSPDAARLAQKRAYSEPGIWSGSDAQKSAFLAELQTHNVIAQQGGRFLTLSFGGNKAEQMTRIIAIYQPRHTIALGDAPNDIAMIEAADFGVIIANPHRPALPPLQGENGGTIIRTQDAGPSGWNTAILDLLAHLDIN